MMPKVSVIIPVYGVEKYIERCARSLFEQSLDDIEYIFINDCTPDASIDVLQRILEEYPDRQNQVRIVAMPCNSGQAAVRKYGISLATGEYVIHCDSDDYVERDMYRSMYEATVVSNNDIVVCGIYEEYGDSTHQIVHPVDDGDLIKYVICQKWGGSLCNKLVKSRIVSDKRIVYPTNNFCEDLALCVQYSALSSRYAMISDNHYHYCIRETSIVSSGGLAPENIVEMSRQVGCNFDIVSDALTRFGMRRRYKDVILHEQLHIKNRLLPVMHSIQCQKDYRRICRKANFPILFARIFSLKEKLTFIFACMGLYPAMKILTVDDVIKN